MSFDFASFSSTLNAFTVNDPTNAAFTAQLPVIIQNAEQRCYRDLDLLAEIVVDSTGILTVNAREFTLPRTFVELQSVNILNGTSRTACTKVSREVIDMLWPDSVSPAGGTIPTQYAPLSDSVILFGPSPGAELSVECIGRVRPTQLSASNTTTFLSLNMPDLFFAAAMVQALGYQQNYGAQSDNPQSALSWDAIYNNLLPGAATESTKQKYQAFAAGKAI